MNATLVRHQVGFPENELEMQMSKIVNLIKPKDIASIPNRVILDCSYHLSSPSLGINGLPGHENYLKSRIPTAQFFDLDAHSDRLSSFPHMLPSKSQFETAMNEFKIKNDSSVIVYDQHLFSSARVWWMFRYYGHKNVFVLDGGMKAFLGSGLPLETGPIQPYTGTPKNDGTRYKVGTVKTGMVIGYNDLLAKIQNYSIFKGFLVDARNSNRFRGLVNEPRAVPSGHMPGAINLPYDNLVDGETGTLINKDGLVRLLEELNIDLKQPLISSCGSGVTACSLLLALDEYGLKKVEDCTLYDGSWSEYASYKTSAIVSENTL